MEIVETSEALQKLFYEYTHLAIGGKEVRCPYWMNLIYRGICGPWGGKGRPEQIIEVVKKEALMDELELNTMTEEAILDFMRKKKLGVDCSGFVFWMLNALDVEKGGNGVMDDIPECKGSFVGSRANVKLLTSEKHSFSLQSIEEFKVGYMLKLRGGRHIAVILSIEKKDGRVKIIEYAHSSEKTMIEGVHSAKIEVINPGSGVEAQKWEEVTKDGENYGKLCFSPQLGDGIRRLKIWA